MDYNRGKIGEFDEPVKRKAGRPVSEFTEKIAIYMTKDMLDYINIAAKFEQDRSAYIRRLVAQDMALHKEEYEKIFNKGGNKAWLLIF